MPVLVIYSFKRKICRILDRLDLDLDFLNNSLERIVSPKSENIKRRLLTKGNITFENAYTTAIGDELTERELKIICTENENENVNKLVHNPYKQAVFLKSKTIPMFNKQSSYQANVLFH